MNGSEVGSYDAKTRLPELLRMVQAGQRFTITHRGKPVAELVPIDSLGEADVQAAIAALRAMPKIQGVSNAELATWVAEGRR